MSIDLEFTAACFLSALHLSFAFSISLSLSVAPPTHNTIRESEDVVCLLRVSLNTDQALPPLLGEQLRFNTAQNYRWIFI